MIEFLMMLIPMFRSYKVVVEAPEENSQGLITWTLPLDTLIASSDEEIGRFTCFEWLGFAPSFFKKVDNILLAYMQERFV